MKKIKLWINGIAYLIIHMICFPIDLPIYFSDWKEAQLSDYLCKILKIKTIN